MVKVTAQHVRVNSKIQVFIYSHRVCVQTAAGDTSGVKVTVHCVRVSSEGHVHHVSVIKVVVHHPNVSTNRLIEDWNCV